MPNWASKFEREGGIDPSIRKYCTSHGNIKQAAEKQVFFFTVVSVGTVTDVHDSDIKTLYISAVSPLAMLAPAGHIYDLPYPNYVQCAPLSEFDRADFSLIS